jgi:hypothetical protein
MKVMNDRNPSSNTHAESEIPALILELRQPQVRPVRFEVTSEEFLIGSVSGCDLRLSGTNLPASIALVTRQSSGPYLKRLSPALPILLNGNPLPMDEIAQLRHGDTVSIGAVDLAVEASLVIPKQVELVEPIPRSQRIARELDDREKALAEREAELESDRIIWYQRRSHIEEELNQAQKQIADLQERAANFPDPEILQDSLKVRESAIEKQFQDLEAAKLEFEKYRSEFLEQHLPSPVHQKPEAEFLLEQEVTLLRESIHASRNEVIQLTQVNQSLRSQMEADWNLKKLEEARLQLQERELELETRAAVVDRRFDQLKSELRAHESELISLQLKQDALRQEEDRIRELRNQQIRLDRQWQERLSQVEGQQGILASLRNRLEGGEEKVRQELAKLGLQRHELELQERTFRQREQEWLNQQSSLGERQREITSIQAQLEERKQTMTEAILRLRDVQDQIRAEEAKQREWSEELALREKNLLLQEEQTQNRIIELESGIVKLNNDRIDLNTRIRDSEHAEEARQKLMEQLRRRSEELLERDLQLAKLANDLTARQEELLQKDKLLEQTREELIQTQQLLEAQASGMTEEESTKLKLRAELEQLGSLLRSKESELIELRRSLEEIKSAPPIVSGPSFEVIQESRAAFHAEIQEWFAHLPRLEDRAKLASEKALQSRDELKLQLAELHGYAQQSQEELQLFRSQLQAELERVRLEEGQLNRARTEYRHSVTSFRQQLVEWQSRFQSMKSDLARSESRLEEREAAVSQTSEILAKKAEELSSRQRLVTGMQSEVERHLGDLREWYRRKMREMVDNRSIRETGIEPSPTILAFPSEIDPSDKRLGEWLQQQELVDSETIQTLWQESQRQRRPLRQVLLAGGYLTLYQLALIEAGNLSRLAIGRFRILDRVGYSSHETLYKVLDPQVETNGSESGANNRLLRQLGEVEMADPTRPDEYRQRFLLLRDLAHPNINATLEVLDVQSRPTVIQSWNYGIPATEWPETRTALGVWYRLVMQATLGLHAAHEAGLRHGNLTPECFCVTPDGTLKILGIGEPRWLTPTSNASTQEMSIAEELTMFGRIIGGWIQTTEKPKRGKTKAMPEGAQSILARLKVDNFATSAPPYSSSGELLTDLSDLGDRIPGDQAAWEQFLMQLQELTTPGRVRKVA